jgi:hypothetical protein
MTRQETIDAYGEPSAGGTIQRPGKFEGEMIYLPTFYDRYLEGFCDDDGKIITVDITAADRIEFPELGESRRVVKFYQDDQGFVCEA